MNPHVVHHNTMKVAIVFPNACMGKVAILFQNSNKILNLISAYPVSYNTRRALCSAEDAEDIGEIWGEHLPIRIHPPNVPTS